MKREILTRKERIKCGLEEANQKFSSAIKKSDFLSLNRAHRLIEAATADLDAITGSVDCREQLFSQTYLI